jgi:stage IV sporulation protein FB
MKRLWRVATIGGVGVYVHWSLLVLGALMLAASYPSLGGTVIAIFVYIAIVLLHEWGHVFTARRYGCAIYGIELYPLVGLTRFSMPRSYFDSCVIAWGGILAQVVVGVPLVLLGFGVGPRMPGPLAAVIGIFGYLSLFIAALNLLPVHPMDGSKAWSLIPMLLARGIGVYLRPNASKRPRKGKWVH